MRRKRHILVFGGVLSLAVAVFQAVIGFSPEDSLYYGAPTALAARPPLLAAAGILAAVVFTVFGLYGLSGGRVIRPLPLLRPGLVGIAGIYLVRGMAIIPVMIGRVRSDGGPGSETELRSALVALAIGILYGAGTVACWNELETAGQNHDGVPALRP